MDATSLKVEKQHEKDNEIDGNLNEISGRDDANFDSKYDRKLVLRIDFMTLPLVVIFYLLSYLDRTNIGNARLAGLEDDLKITEQQFKIALTILYIPYILSDIPSNLIIKKVGPDIWLPSLVVAFGIVGAFQGIIKNATGLYINRFFLGMVSGGVLPGIILYLSGWYKPHELQLRIGMFWTASSIAGAFSGFFAAAIQSMHGLGGLKGWRWIFIIEGMITAIPGVLGFFLMPRSIEKTKQLTSEQKYWARKRIYMAQQHISSSIVCHPVTGESPFHSGHFKWSYVLSCFKTFHVLLLCIIAFASGTSVYSCAYFLPTIIRSLAKSNQSIAIVQLLTVPPYIVSFFVVLLTSYYADRRARRLNIVIYPSILAILGFALLYNNISNRVDYFAVFLVVSGVYAVFPTFLALISNNVAGYYKRATGLGLMIVMTNSGGILATWVFNVKEHPKYVSCYRINIALMSLAVVVAVILRFYYVRENLKRDRILASRTDPINQEEEFYKAQEQGDKYVGFRYTL